MTKPVLRYLESDRENAVNRLKKFLSIPSVSADSKHRGDCRTAAQYVVDTLKECGLDCELVETDGHPIVLATTPDELLDDGAADAPAMLFYGHYDVQPPDPLEKWETPPFEPTVRDGNLYARGATDDKGQVSCFLEAVRAWRNIDNGKLPCRVTILIEGEEEVGSANLNTFLDSNQDKLTADVVLICDTSMWNPQTIAITYGLRGLIYFEVKLHGPNRDLHSGVYGGILANPTNELVKVLGGLFDENHQVTVPGFYDDVLPITDEERAHWAKLNFDEIRDCLGPIGIDEGFGEAGFETLARRWARPSCDINGLFGGYMAEGAKTVIPSFAGAKVSFRLAANQDPRKIGPAFREWVESHKIPGCRWEVTEFKGHADPVVLPIDSPYISAAQRASTTTSGKPAVLMREGATIPVVSDFKTQLGVESLLLGFGLNSDNLHSPNEHFALDRFYLGAETTAMFIEELGLMKKRS